ncbi:MAG: hypothetical protein JWQ66_4428 [Mucilaginibacter sp.]|nr:hypothetical protein [Mucilaginibacter sp.]
MLVNNKLVSIIIPVYNAEKYLKETVQSALAQTWINKEIIVVDDGSTDNSLKIANSFRDTHVRVFCQPNKGAAAARNFGLSVARGQFIQFLDADDLLSKYKIEQQVLDLEGQYQKLAVCCTVHFNDGQPAISAPSPEEEKFLKKNTVPIEFLIRLWGGYDNQGSMIQPNAWLIPIDLIKRTGLWNEDLTLDDDGEYFCRLILNSDGIVKSRGVFNYYRKYLHNQSLSGQRSHKDLKSLLMAALSKKSELLSRNNTIEARHAIYRQLYDVFLFSYPSFPDLYKKAKSELPENSIPYRPSLGGSIINGIAAVFGMKAALWIRYFAHK